MDALKILIDHKNIICFLIGLIIGVSFVSSSTRAEQTEILQNNYSTRPLAVQWANRGIELANQGEFSQAVEALFEAWKLSPEKSNEFSDAISSTLNNQAKQAAEKGKLDEAVRLLRKAVFFNENNKVANSNLDLALKQKRLNPNDFNTRLEQARQLRAGGFIEESVAEYRKALALSTNSNKADLLKAKLELAQVYQVIYSKYAQAPVGISRFESMAGLIEEIYREAPQDPRSQILLARAYASGGKLAEAITTYEKALILKPNDKEALDGLIGVWRQVVKIAPNEPDNLIGLGSALIRTGEVDEGQKLLEKAKSLKPNNPEIDKLLASSKLKGQYAKSFELAEKGLLTQKAGKLDEAVRLYQQALKDLPPLPETSNIYYNLGLVYQDQDKFGDAAQAYNQAIKYNPANKDAQTALKKLGEIKLAKRKDKLKEAVQLQEANQVKEAITIYENLLKDTPGDSQVQFNLGTAYQQLENYPQALKYYQEASRLDPKNEEYKMAMLAIQDALQNGTWQAKASNKIIKEALELQGKGNLQGAIRKYRDALKTDPDNAQGHFNLGTALHAENKSEEAIKEYQKAYQLDPANFPEANYFIASLYETKNNKTEALAFYRRYLEDEPNSTYSASAQEKIQSLNIP
ncbi:MAG: tetratricopeptide repeat protein [Candidatus Caenarcaniphilales bacterium]|nr:tetratricopeptide repeat protein [Candidatus Caenarcaniphilales bacterium]